MARTLILLYATLFVSVGGFSIASSYAQTGIVHERSFVHGDSLRTYMLFVPAAYDGQEAWPLVINFHGHGITAPFQMGIDRMAAAPNAGGFLFAYPVGLTVVNPFERSGPGWNYDGLLSQNDDVGFASALIDHVMGEYAVDPARIHATGWSNGSQMSFAVACALPDRIASIAGVAGPMNDAFLEACEAGRPYSAMLIHGMADAFFPPEGVSVGGYDYSDPQETPAFWARQNNCAPEPLAMELEDVDPDDNSTVTRFEYAACDDGAEVLYFRVNNGGHTWPSGSFPRSSGWPESLGPVNRDLDASAVILDFFIRNPHPALSTAIEQEKPKLSEQATVEVYPNPFAERFTLDLTLPRTSRVRFTLINLLGQRVGTLIQQTVPAGRQRIEWEAAASGLPPGLYFVRLQVDEERMTKPILHLAR